MEHMHNCPHCEQDIPAIAITARNNILAHVEDDDVHLSEEDRKLLTKLANSSGNNITGNPSGPSQAPAQYATQAWVQSLNYLTESALNGYATKNYVNQAILEIQIGDPEFTLDDYVKRDELEQFYPLWNN